MLTPVDRDNLCLHNYNHSKNLYKKMHSKILYLNQNGIKLKNSKIWSSYKKKIREEKINKGGKGDREHR